MNRPPICDACGQESERALAFSYPCHLEDLENPAAAFIDRDGNRCNLGGG